MKFVMDVKTVNGYRIGNDQCPAWCLSFLGPGLHYTDVPSLKAVFGMMQ